jgi:hypothetical protein
LHPAFGLDEDWNFQPLAPSDRLTLNCIRLSGWMRIGTIDQAIDKDLKIRLHPAFGLDEDWNN